LDHRRHDARRRDGDVHAPRLVEHPLVLRVVDARDRARHAELRLREQGHDEVDLVVARRGHDDVALVDLRVRERRQLARVREQPVRLGDLGDAHRRRLLVDQHDLVVVAEELPGDRAADRARSRDDDAHHSASTFGAWVSRRSTAAARSSSMITCSTSFSCRTVRSVTTVPSPNRLTNATRAPVASSMARTVRPIQPGWKSTCASRTRPDGSRYSSVAPNGSMRRSTWSAVHRTVPTVGMPRRWWISARCGSQMRATTVSTPNVSRTTRAERMFELSPSETAAKAYASSMPACTSVSRSNPTPVTFFPVNSEERRRNASGFWSTAATECPLDSRDWARVAPTRPQPMITKCTSRTLPSGGPPGAHQRGRATAGIA